VGQGPGTRKKAMGGESAPRDLSGGAGSMRWDGLAAVLNPAQAAAGAGAGGSGGCIGVSRLGQDPGPSCSTLPFCGRVQ
jgi:hypothetical protein